MAEYRLRRLETCEEEEETCVPMQCLYLSLPDIKKTNGRLEFLMTGGKLDFPKLQRWNGAITICTKLSPWKLVWLVQMDALSLNYWLTKFIQSAMQSHTDGFNPKFGVPQGSFSRPYAVLPLH